MEFIWEMKKRGYSSQEIDGLSLLECQIYQNFIKLERKRELDLVSYHLYNNTAPHLPKNTDRKNYIKTAQESKQKYLKPLSILATETNTKYQKGQEFKQKLIEEKNYKFLE